MKKGFVYVDLENTNDLMKPSMRIESQSMKN